MQKKDMRGRGAFTAAFASMSYKIGISCPVMSVIPLLEAVQARRHTAIQFGVWVEYECDGPP